MAEVQEGKDCIEVRHIRLAFQDFRGIYAPPYRTRPSMKQLTHSLIQIIWGPYPAMVISLTLFLKPIVSHWNERQDVAS